MAGRDRDSYPETPRGRGGDRAPARDDDRGGRARARDDDRDERPARGGRDRDDSRGGRSTFSYQKRDAATVRDRAQQGGTDFDQYLKTDAPGYVPHDNDNDIRILPPTWEDNTHYGLDIWVHYSVGPDRQTYLCLHKMKGEPCPICEERQRAARTDEEYAKELEPKRRVLMYLIDRKNERDGVHVWAAPWTIDRDILQISEDKRTGEVLSIDHPDEGYDISFIKSGTKDRTKYSGVSIARRESPLGKDSWLEVAVDKPLPTILNYFSYEHIAKEFGGGGSFTPKSDAPSRARDDDRDERPARGGRDRDDSRGRNADPVKLSWSDVHDMTMRELDAVIEAEGLSGRDIEDASDASELADAICAALDIDPPRSTKRASGDDDDTRSSDRARLDRMGRR